MRGPSERGASVWGPKNRRLSRPWLYVAQLTHDGGLEIDEYSSRYMLSGAGFAKEGIETVVTAAEDLI